MSSIIQVIVFCAVCLKALSESIQYARTTVDEDVSNIPGLAIYKDMHMWKNNQDQCLTETFGSNENQWIVGRGDVVTVKDMSFTAMCCLHSKKLIDFVQTVELRLKDYGEQHSVLTRVFFETATDDNLDEKFFKQKPISSLRPVVVRMLTAVLDYSKNYNVRANKYLLNALMTFHLLLSDRKPAEHDVPIDTNTFGGGNFVEHLTRVNIYIRNSVEAFSIRNCSSSTFEDDRLFETTDKYVKWLSGLNFPTAHFTQDLFVARNMMLTDVLDIELIAGREETRLKYLPVFWQYKKVEMLHVYNGLINGYCAEKITKFQTLMFECISSVVFYLIKAIAKLNSTSGSDVTAAINALEGFDFPGLSRVTLRTIKYEKMFVEEGASQSVKTHLNKSVFLEKDFETFIGAEENVYTLREILHNFTHELEAMKRYISNAIDINKYLCDYEYEEVGFLQYPPENSEPFKTAQEKYCVFSSNVITHFILGGLIISHCESMAIHLSTSADNDFTAKDLHECLTVVENSIKMLANNFNSYLDSTAGLFTYQTLTNHKVTDTVLAATLYFGDNNIVEQLRKSTDPRTENGPVDFGLVLSKFKVLKRYQVYLINFVEQFTVLNCSMGSPRTEVIPNVNTLVNQQCKTFINKSRKLKLVNCIRDIMVGFKRKYLDRMYPKIVKKDFTIDKLLMNTIIEKARTTSSDLSMILDVRVYWEGQWRSLMEIRDFVTADIHPKYLCNYQVATIKAVIFVVYEIMKTIVSTSNTPENIKIYRDNIQTMSAELRFISSPNFPFRINTGYDTIIQLFDKYFKHTPGIDKGALLEIIESEQSYLELQLRDKTTLISFSSDQTNVSRLITFVKYIKEEVWSDLSKVARVLNALTVDDIVIQ